MSKQLLTLFDEYNTIGRDIKKAKRNNKGGSANPIVFHDYESYVAKFQDKEKTTDDTYTPKDVYEAVVSYVGEMFDLTDKQILRPFYPGGDYENAEYPDNGVVIDNPPFSIFTKICKFYSENNIPFFLFGPGTLVTVADYILQHTPGNTVSNLSSTRALRDVTRKYGCEYNAAAVGEVNVVTKMKETGAVIGGEGNGGVIYPAAHYGRDALVGIALILTYLAKKGMKTSELRATYPPYFIAKNRIDLTPDTDVDAILAKVKELYKNEEVNDIDGVKIDFPDKWVHLRKSNTEPIIRVYSEAATMEAADAIGKKIMQVVYDMQ